MKARPSVVLLAILACSWSLGARPFAYRLVTEESREPNGSGSSLQGLRYRLVGPFRGGRATTVAGVRGDPRTYYFGAAGGGVWKTTNGGIDWTPISDDQGIGAVGSLAVAPSDPSILYVGTGDADLRNNASHGNGVYKSADAGHTWRHVGLADTRHIGKVLIHPSDPSTAFVAAFGHAFGPNEERGVFRTKNGGESWQKVLFVDSATGAIDLALDPRKPSVMFATMWQARREPWMFTSGGPGSGLFRSTDGGDTWARLQGRGLPDGPLGRVGVEVSPAHGRRVYALIEAKRGGLYRSDDGGESWQLINDDPALRQRPWFFMTVVADPQDPDVVYVMNINLLKSIDGGRMFHSLPQHHVDNQALWIAPEDSNRVINANDGGANVSVDGGRTWTGSDSQPTGQFYHVATDNRFPYYLYGGLQDHETLAIASRSDYPGISERDWYPLVNCEMGFAVPDPRDPEIVYGGCTDGGISRYDHRTKRSQSIEPWPDTSLGHEAAAAKYRFQWTAPIMLSQHDPTHLYYAGNVLFRSTDEGNTWTSVSPDLTRNDRTKQLSSGGPITKDNVGGEVYNTIFALAESPRQRGLLWVGTDDGLLHLTRDSGRHWENVTPADVPEWSRISLIDPSPHDPAVAYVAIDRHMLDDYTPYILRTADYGRSWTEIAGGIPRGTFVRAVREDVVRRGLLYAGTETGVYVSLDDGTNWQSLQQNLPVSPVHDLLIKANDLVVATHGRAFWILDDVTPLREMAQGIASGRPHLFKPATAHRIRNEFTRAVGPAGENPPSGAIVYYRLPRTTTGPVEMAITDSKGSVVRSYTSRPAHDSKALDPFGVASPVFEAAGLHRFVWDLRYAPHRPIPGHLLFWHFPHAPPAGALTMPGNYVVRLTVDGETFTRPLEVRADPRVEVRQEDLEAAFQLHARITETLNAITDAVLTIRRVRPGLAQRPDGAKLVSRLSAIEEALIEPRMRVGSDAFRFPLRLDNRLVTLLGIVANSDRQPTRSSYEVFDHLQRQVSAHIEELRRVTAELP